jgi:hypothetical protein
MWLRWLFRQLVRIRWLVLLTGRLAMTRAELTTRTFIRRLICRGYITIDKRRDGPSMCRAQSACGPLSAPAKQTQCSEAGGERGRYKFRLAGKPRARRDRSRGRVTNKHATRRRRIPARAGALEANFSSTLSTPPNYGLCRSRPGARRRKRR